ncbi:Annexin-B10 [Arthrobotrys entomopaga]|nr:Annexin-B10 [Arthrobotrys entomopaga]
MMASYQYYSDPSNMYHQSYIHPNQGQYPPANPNPQWDPSSASRAYPNAYGDPSGGNHQAGYDQHQIFVFSQPTEHPPPSLPHLDPTQHGMTSVQSMSWDNQPVQQPAQYQLPPVGQTNLVSPPAYNGFQRPISWPSSPQEYQNHYGTSTTGYHTTAPNYPPPSPQSNTPTAADTYTPSYHSNSHSQHYSISGPIPPLIAPTKGFPVPPSNNTARMTDSAMDDAMKIRDAFGVGGLYHAPLISIIAHRSPDQLEDLLLSYKYLTSHDLLRTLKDVSRANKFSNLIDINNKHFYNAATAILLGPVRSEGFWAIKAVKGGGTNETLLTESLFGRTNDEMDAMKGYVQSNYCKTLEEYVHSDLSMGTKEFFDMAMMDHPSKDPRMPSHPEQDKIEVDTRKVMFSMPSFKLFSKNAMPICQIFAQRTPAQLVAIANEYKGQTGKNLRDTISKSFIGHMKDALIYILDGALDRVERDAKSLEDAMEGAGTRNHLLISRLIRIHWNKHHLAEVKYKYSQLYKQDLVSRIRKEVRGSYRDLMIALVESDTSPWRT